MAAITAALVNELRSKTGQPMMNCKKMLVETEGDVELAVRKFREAGVKTSILERAASEGRVAAATSADRKTAVLVEVTCNTDFTAKSDTVLGILDKGVAKLLGAPTTDLAGDADLKSDFVSVAQQTGENVQLGRALALTATGTAGSYLYSTAGKGKVAVLLAFGGSANEEVVRQVGMQVVAAKPIALTRAEVPADVLDKEREIAVEQAKQSGKPQQIAEKIAEGKLNAFYGEKVLLDQEFIDAGQFKGKVSDLLKKHGTTLEKFVRVEVGQA